MIEQAIVFGISAIAGALCLAIGYWSGQRKVTKVSSDWQSKFAVVEATVAMCRAACDTTKEELGNIYAALQMQDAEHQKRQMEDMKKVEKSMRDAILTGQVPMPASPLHPKVDRGLRQPTP